MAAKLTENEWRRLEHLAGKYTGGYTATLPQHQPQQQQQQQQQPRRQNNASPSHIHASPPALQRSSQNRWGIATAPSRTIGVNERRAAFAMFDVEAKGFIWGFDLSVCMQAAGYSANEEAAGTLLKSFGVVQGAPLTLTQFLALCDYYEGLVRNESPRGKQTHRSVSPTYDRFPGYQKGGRVVQRVASVSAGSEGSGVTFADSDMPLPPQLQTPGDPDIQRAAFVCFDIDRTGRISIIDLPGAFRTAGFKKVEFAPHVLNVMHTCGIEGAHVVYTQFQRLCSALTEKGVKYFAKRQ